MAWHALHGIWYGLAGMAWHVWYVIRYGSVGMSWYIVRPGGHGKWYELECYMVWSGTHTMVYCVVYGMAWRAWHSILYGLAGMAWYIIWPGGHGMACNII